MAFNKVRLRNTLRKLRQLPLDRSDLANTAIAPQEMLDFLAMLAGFKHVYLLGRGFDDRAWIEGLLALAKQMTLHVLEGPKWYAEPEHAGMPDWYATLGPSAEAQEQVFYICRARGIADEVRRTLESGEITIDQEARLLGYPVCCVRDHYRSTRLMKEAFSLMLHRTAGGDEREMRRIVEEGIQMEAQTIEEISHISEATTLQSAPFTSINMCSACAEDPESPAMEISRNYERLARGIDPEIVQEIFLAQSGLART